MEPRRLPSTIVLLLLTGCATVAALASAARPQATAEAPAAERGTRTEPLEIVRVVDGDTLHVRRDGKVEKLRLLHVDTEERMKSDVQGSPTKPKTVFGEECALWAQEFFAGLGSDGAPPRVALWFPDGAEQRDVYGRLLCHVLLPDGRDYNLMLVELGKSPYFNKYGNSEIHERFVAAQAKAREGKLGIWNPATNRASTPGAPSAVRPYADLLAWWDARAAAVDAFRARRAKEPERTYDALDPASLARAAAAEGEVEVFAEVGEIFEETSGDRTVLMRSGQREAALRVRIPQAVRAKHDALDLDGLAREMRQNYVWVKGRVTRGARGFEIVGDDPARWRRAGPEPAVAGGR